MPAPVASGWSGRRAGLAPAGKAPPCHGARGSMTSSGVLKVSSRAGALRQLRLEAADAKPGQGRLHAVDNAGPFADQARALPTGSFGIFLIDGRHGDHAAVAAFSAKPADKHAHEHRRIEPVGLRAPMLT